MGTDTTDTPTERGPGGPLRVLLIDDDEDERFLTRERLDEVPGRPYALDWTPDFETGLEAVCAGSHDVYLLDYRLGARTGVELLREARTRGATRAGPVILLTGQAHSRADGEALDAGADDYLEKAGLTPALLDRAIRYAVAQSRAAAELERKVRERTAELARANAALRDADRRKDEFLALLAHELRNPLTPIVHALEILRLANDTGDTVTRQRERMERQVAQLNRLVEDLLDVSRITTGKMRLAPEPLIAQEIVDTAVDAGRPQFEKAGVQLLVDVPAEPLRLTGDRVRLAQVLGNLLNNAVKFTERGGTVWLTLRAAVDRLVFIVRDTGVGIPGPLLPQIFDMFNQVERTVHRSHTGLGIGLSLVQRLTELHGGAVTAHSDGPGKGATFTVDLPARAAERATVWDKEG